MFYLGTVTGASGAYSNQATGLSGIGTFAIPTGTRELYLAPSASGILCEIAGASHMTTAARAAQLNFAPAGGGIINGPYRVPPGGNPTVAIYNSAGGFVSVRVYAGGPR